jgi:hypothetical protein
VDELMYSAKARGKGQLEKRVIGSTTDAERNSTG